MVSLYCPLNCWHSRHAHCLITGPGYLAYAAFVVEAALGHSLISRSEGIVFLAVFVLAVSSETAWQSRSGTNAID